MRNSPWWLLLAGVVAHAGANAESAAEQLTRIESETALLKARERKLEVQAQIAGREAEIAARRADIHRSVQPWTSSDPLLRGIDGVGEKLFATLEMPNRGLVEVRRGDTLSDGSRVSAIRPGEVIIESGKRRVKLGVTMAPPPAQQTGEAPYALPALPQPWSALPAPRPAPSASPSPAAQLPPPVATNAMGARK
jgi:type IV pilus biogenesis protein PilP